MKKSINTKGVSALITTIVISAVALLLVSGMALVNIDLNQNSINRERGSYMFYGTDACIEEASRLLRNNINYTGGDIAINDVACTVLVEGTGTQRTLTITSSLEEKYSRSIRVIVDWSDGYHFIDWKEITD